MYINIIFELKSSLEIRC